MSYNTGINPKTSFNGSNPTCIPQILFYKNNQNSNCNLFSNPPSNLSNHSPPTAAADEMKNAFDEKLLSVKSRPTIKKLSNFITENKNFQTKISQIFFFLFSLQYFLLLLITLC
jgi:hypothetical protein